jgi:hypothetical protein
MTMLQTWASGFPSGRESTSRACPISHTSASAGQWRPRAHRTCVSWYTHGVTSLLGAAGVLGRELEGEGGPLRMVASFKELFLLRDEASEAD